MSEIITNENERIVTIQIDLDKEIKDKWDSERKAMQKEIEELKKSYRNLQDTIEYMYKERDKFDDRMNEKKKEITDLERKLEKVKNMIPERREKMKKELKEDLIDYINKFEVYDDED